MIAPDTARDVSPWRIGLAQAVQRAWWQPRPMGIARVLQPLSWLFRLLAAINALLNGRALGRDRAPQRTPTIVVGNWVVGGAGKTPTTLAVIRHLQAQGWKPGVVSRGYGRLGQEVRMLTTQDDPAEAGDEPLLIARLTGVPVCVGRDRRAARARLWAAHPEVDIIVADDGLQHHRLSRDVEIVVVDERGAGNGLCLPAGPLRQPVPTTVSPRSLVLYSGGRASLDLPGVVAVRGLRGVQSHAAWLAGEPVPADGGWAELLGRSVHAVAGIASPERFFSMLRLRHLNIVPHPLPDHDPLSQCPWPEEATDVIVTEKDAVKLGNWPPGATRVWVAPLDLQIPPAFFSLLDEQLGPRHTTRGPSVTTTRI